MTGGPVEPGEPGGFTMPTGWTYLEHVAVVKGLRPDGRSSVFISTSPALQDWEALGMLRAAFRNLDDQVAHAFRDCTCGECDR